MTNKYTVFAVVILLLSGCATVSESAQVKVNPLSANGAQWTVTGKAETGMLYDDVTLYVNGTMAASGRLGPAQSDHHNVHIAGSYDHHIILGVCSRSDSDPVTYHCDLSVDGASAGTVTWKADE